MAEVAAAIAPYAPAFIDILEWSRDGHVIELIRWNGLYSGQ